MTSRRSSKMPAAGLSRMIGVAERGDAVAVGADRVELALIDVEVLIVEAAARGERQADAGVQRDARRHSPTCRVSSPSRRRSAHGPAGEGVLAGELIGLADQRIDRWRRWGKAPDRRSRHWRACRLPGGRSRRTCRTRTGWCRRRRGSANPRSARRRRCCSSGRSDELRLRPEGVNGGAERGEERPFVFDADRRHGAADQLVGARPAAGSSDGDPVRVRLQVGERRDQLAAGRDEAALPARAAGRARERAGDAGEIRIERRPAGGGCRSRRAKRS